MKIVITGASEFIGTNQLEDLCETHDVISIDLISQNVNPTCILEKF